MSKSATTPIAMGVSKSLQVLLEYGNKPDPHGLRNEAVGVLHRAGQQIITSWAKGDAERLDYWKCQLARLLGSLWQRRSRNTANLPKTDAATLRYLKVSLKRQRFTEQRESINTAGEVSISSTDVVSDSEKECSQVVLVSPSPDPESEIGDRQQAALLESVKDEFRNLEQKISARFLEKHELQTGKLLAASMAIFFTDTFLSSIKDILQDVDDDNADTRIENYRELLLELTDVFSRTASNLSQERYRLGFAENLLLLMRVVSHLTTIDKEASASGIPASTLRKRMQRVRGNLQVTIDGMMTDNTESRRSIREKLSLSIGRLMLYERENEK
jgi:hypothetical protein